MRRREIADLAGMIALGIIIVVLIIYLPKKKVEVEKFKTLDAAEVQIPDIKIKYGVVVDSLQHFTTRIKRNEHVSDILRRFNVDYATIDRLARNSKDIFDLRKIKRGNPYHIYYSEDSSKKVHFFVYESDKVNYITWDLRNPQQPEVFKGNKTIKTKEKWVAGTIDNSLWMTLKNNGDDPLLALKLSDIYAWTIDFFDIKKGDKYIARYNENYVDGKSIGTGKINSALLIDKGERFYAFHYNKDTIDDYFDEEGASLRRTLLKAPLRYSRISSGYSSSRYHPVLKIYRPHHGIDYAAPRGTPVFSIGDGEVVKKSYQAKGGGRYIRIKHNSIYTSVYMHLSGYAKGIRQGRHVNQGDKIGYVGSSGLATGPHLDFRIYKYGTPVNPVNVEAPPANPIDSARLAEYKSFIKPLKQELDERLEKSEDLSSSQK